MEIPTKAEIEKKIKDIEAGAKEELKDLADKAKEAAQQAIEDRATLGRVAVQGAQHAGCRIGGGRAPRRSIRQPRRGQDGAQHYRQFELEPLSDDL